MRALFAALALVVTVGGCTDITGPGGLFDSTYELRTVNGQTLPYVVDQSTGYRLELTRSVLTLENDGYYTTTFTWRETINGRTTILPPERFDGTYERSGNQLFLYDDEDGSVTTAFWENNRLIVTSGGAEYEYR